MKKNIFLFNILILSIIFSQNIGMPSFAIEKVKTLHSDETPLQVSTPTTVQENLKENGIIYTYYIKKEQSDTANELNIFLAQYLNDLNSHNIQKLKDYYASNFISGDGFNENQITDLIKQTWEKYPDLKYSTAIKNLRLDNNRVSVEFNENITATTRDKSEITKDKGNITGTSHNILYLEKYGCGWKIVSDKTLYEETEIKYGTAKNININFDAPEQVFSGENYLISLNIDLPSDVFALGSLVSVPIIHPLKQPEEMFRQIPSNSNPLERIIKVNNNSLNEISSASVTFCEAKRDSYTSIDLKVTGLALVLKRVNVVHK